MKFHSLAHLTDLMFHRYHGEVRDAGDCLVIHTPDNPGYRWGNMLLFPRPPADGDLERWEARFHDELGTGYRHRVFAWDIDPAAPLADRPGLVAPFLAAGYQLDRNEILAATPETLRSPAQAAPELEIRPLESDRDWREAIALQVLCRDPELSEDGYRAFRKRSMAGYRRMQTDGAGAWFGGFVNDGLVADMGLFVENGVGRYQHVETHPAMRRRGIAGTMIHTLARRAIERRGARMLVLAADPDGPAVELYKRLGFGLQEISFGLELIDAVAAGRGG